MSKIAGDMIMNIDPEPTVGEGVPGRGNEVHAHLLVTDLMKVLHCFQAMFISHPETDCQIEII